MRQPTSRVAQFDVVDRRREFVAAVENVLPGVSQVVEQATMYMLVAVFWGLVLYFALMAL